VGRLRVLALVEVVLCSGYPTQLALAGVLAWVGIAPFDAHRALVARYVIALSLADAALVVGLVAWFLHAHGERVGRVLLGDRPVNREMVVGLVQVPILLLLVAAAMLAIQRFVPWLHNVDRNPFEGLIRTRADAWLLGAVAVVGGGVREEVQRAFILHRFRQHLGGGGVGLAVSSVAFGLGHVIQGYDAAVATALLGAIWGFVYLRRRSVASTVVSHSGFNVAEIFRYTLYGA
jgi:membrane protease YdiL (CAAX protease family)